MVQQRSGDPLMLVIRMRPDRSEIPGAAMPCSMRARGSTEPSSCREIKKSPSTALNCACSPMRLVPHLLFAHCVVGVEHRRPLLPVKLPPAVRVFFRFFAHALDATFLLIVDRRARYMRPDAPGDPTLDYRFQWHLGRQREESKVSASESAIADVGRGSSRGRFEFLVHASAERCQLSFRLRIALDLSRELVRQAGAARDGMNSQTRADHSVRPSRSLSAGSRVSCSASWRRESVRVGEVDEMDT